MSVPTYPSAKRLAAAKHGERNLPQPVQQAVAEDDLLAAGSFLNKKTYTRRGGLPCMYGTLASSMCIETLTRAQITASLKMLMVTVMGTYHRLLAYATVLTRTLTAKLKEDRYR